MKKLAQMRPRERRFALIAGVVIGSWVLVTLIIQPLMDRAREAKMAVEGQMEKFDALSGLIAKQARIERTADGIAPYLAEQGTDDAPGAFLNELEALSRQSKVAMNIKPYPVKDEGRTSRFEVELEVSGSQETILAFLDALLAMPRLISVERLRFSSSPSREHALRSIVVIELLSLIR